MRKIFFVALIALMLSVQNFCGAATIESAKFNGSDKLIYPVVQVGNSAVDEKINGKIQTELRSFIKQMHYAAQYEGNTVEDMRMSYEVGSNESGGTVILSIVLTKSWYYKGAAHPATVMETLNFNTATGARMGLDYLTDIGDGVSVDELRGRVEQALIRHCERENLQLFNDALPLKNLPENFYWDENLHVHFIFQHYEVAPYAEGIIDVDIDD